MIVFPPTSACDASKGELPRSKPDGARPRTSPIQSWPTPAARRANASSTLLTTMILAAPRASTTAAVVNARNTSMIATDPVARLAPDSRLSMRISIGALPLATLFTTVTGCPQLVQTHLWHRRRRRQDRNSRPHAIRAKTVRHDPHEKSSCAPNAAQRCLRTTRHAVLVTEAMFKLSLTQGCVHEAVQFYDHAPLAPARARSGA